MAGNRDPESPETLKQRFMRVFRVLWVSVPGHLSTAFEF